MPFHISWGHNLFVKFVTHRVLISIGQCSICWIVFLRWRNCMDHIVILNFWKKLVVIANMVLLVYARRCVSNMLTRFVSRHGRHWRPPSQPLILERFMIHYLVIVPRRIQMGIVVTSAALSIISNGIVQKTHLRLRVTALEEDLNLHPRRRMTIGGTVLLQMRIPYWLLTA